MMLHSSRWELLTGNLSAQALPGILTAYFGGSASTRTLMILHGITLLGSEPRNQTDP